MLSRISVGQLVTATIDAYPGKTFPGRIMAINPAVDPNSRNVQVRADLPNPDHLLRPGMFASVNVSIGAAQADLGETLAELLERARGAMSSSIQEGGNHITSGPRRLACLPS